MLYLILQRKDFLDTTRKDFYNISYPHPNLQLKYVKKAYLNVFILDSGDPGENLTGALHSRFWHGGCGGCG